MLRHLRSLVEFDLLTLREVDQDLLRHGVLLVKAHFLEQTGMLSADDQLLGQFDCTFVRPEALQMVGGGAGNTLEDLDRVARDAAATAVVKWAAEVRLILVVRVDVHIVVLTQAVEVVELETGPNDAFLDKVGGRRHLLRLLVVAITARNKALVFGARFGNDLAVVFTQVALGFIFVTTLAHEGLLSDATILFEITLRELALVLIARLLSL